MHECESCEQLQGQIAGLEQIAETEFERGYRVGLHEAIEKLRSAYEERIEPVREG